MSTKVRLQDVRIAFVDTLVGDAKEYEPGDGKFRHSATFLVTPDSENHKALETAFRLEASTVWLKKADVILESIRTNAQKFCYQKGDLKDYDGFEGMMSLAGHRKAKEGRPLLLDSVGWTDPEDGKFKPKRLVGSDGKFFPGKEGRIYAGCYVNATVEIYAQAGVNAGMRCGLLGVQFNREGDSFGGASRAKEGDFEVIDAPEMAEDDIS